MPVGCGEPIVCGIVGLYQKGQTGGLMSKVLGFLTVDSKGRTTIPREMRQELGLDQGAHLRVERSESGGLKLIPSVSVPLDQAWFYSDAVKARIAKGESDLAAGLSRRTNGPEETQRYLDSLKSAKGEKPSRTK